MAIRIPLSIESKKPKHHRGKSLSTLFINHKYLLLFSSPNVFALRGGKLSFVSDMSAKCTFERSKAIEFTQALSGALTLVTEYLIAKVNLVGEEPSKKDTLKNFTDLCTASCDQ